ncbi:hypothetical protein CAC42_1385 [Sphaceloma murrayae]|uniref:Uncharacterized protein n=1 Tax=Sphaceloma murrayae TaxID=2082308 RepID=A0A2K1QFK4_9PEZI|nr:hypothetical protein CAC42_1385 [Sphaceloma murrayae]
MTSPAHLQQLQLNALTWSFTGQETEAPSGDEHFDWESHLHMTREAAVSPYRYSVDINRYLDADGTISSLDHCSSIEDDSSGDSDFRASLERIFGDVYAPANMDSTPERTRWYRSSRPSSKLQRTSSAVSRRPSTASCIDPALLIRRSPIEFEDNYTVPAPPPTGLHPALRPPAARNASDGTGRKSSMSLDIPRPSSSATRRGSTDTRSMSKTHPALTAARSIRQRVAQARTSDPTKPFPTPASPLIETQPLPVIWTTAHDRAICVLDARNYTTEQSIRKLRRAFPELSGCYLSTRMIERRLQVLDQNTDIDYFRVGLDFRSTKNQNSPSTTDSRHQARMADRLPSTTSTGSGSSVRSGYSETSTSSSSTFPSTFPGKNQMGRRKAGTVLGLANEMVLGKGGRPMSIIDERPGSVLSSDGITALPVRERDKVMDRQRAGMGTTASLPTETKREDADAGESEGRESERRVTGLRKLAERGHKTTGSGCNVKNGLMARNDTGG